MKKAIIESSRILISVKEASEYAELSEKTMRSLMRKNGFIIRIGREHLFARICLKPGSITSQNMGEYLRLKKKTKHLLSKVQEGCFL